MALIPSDVGIRMRVQADLPQQLAPAQPIAEIPADLPELRPGQTFTARIQEALPENTFKALIAGKSLTLSLPEGAKPGDTLELVLVDRSAKVLIAHRLPDASGAGGPKPYPFATVSPAGQLIASLLTAEGETPPPAVLNRGQALLPGPPANAAQLAPALSEAIRGSGLFYESHQAQWVAGQFPLAQLLAEPQGRHSGAMAMLAAGMLRAQENPEGGKESGVARRREASLLQSLFGGEASAESPEAGPPRSGGSEQAAAKAALQAVPEELRPLVQQQLDALATHRLAWHGEAWPGQPLEWEVEWQENAGGDDTATEAVWFSSLRFSSPRLGSVDARVQLTSAGVRIAMLTPHGATAADLQDAAPELEQALSAAGIPLLGLVVRHDERNG